MGSVLKKSGKKTGKKGLNQRYKWVEFVTSRDENEDEEYTVRCRVRTSLMNVEIERLMEFDATKDKAEDLFEIVHPYVTDWDVQVVDEDGDLCDVIAPAEGGATSFHYAPQSLVWAIVNSLTNEAFRKVDPKSSTPVETTE